MFKPLEIPVITPGQQRVQPTDDANNVFRVLHGFYGNLFLSKFATGDVTADGGDAGVASARAIWAHGLREFDVSVVKTALSRTMAAHPEYPPTLPQFVALCKAAAPRAVYQFALPAPAVNQAAHAKRAREALERMKATTAPASGLTLLKQAIADAVGCAGGDEAAELVRLDAMFAGAV